MLPLSLGLPLAIISLIGFLVNAYIVLVVVLTKQVSANNILLLHLGIVNALLCTAFLVFSVPNIARNDGSAAFGEAALCTVHGILVTAMHPVALWTLCCLNCDRYYAIAAPLHYGAIVNTRRVVFGLAAGWSLALALSIPPVFQIAPYRYNAALGACVPHFANGGTTTTPTDTAPVATLWYAIVYTVTTLLVPIALIIGCNIKVLMIARYHRHRIASAIYEVTLSAQVTITHQRNPFFVPLASPPKLRSRSPVTSVLQLIGTVVLMYVPYYACIMWNSSAAALRSGATPLSSDGPGGTAMMVASVPVDGSAHQYAHPHVLVAAASLLACSPFVNGLLYGVKSKIMRKTFQNYWRKQKTKNEMCQEIQARTPSTCGSRRPSLSTLSVFQRPAPQRRLSETYVDHERPLMKRIASEISWRPTSLTFADLNESPTMLTPVAVAAAAAVGDEEATIGGGYMSHTTSCNTLQLPVRMSSTNCGGGASNSDAESPTLPQHNSHSNGGAHRSSLGTATAALIHKMLRIEIGRDDGQQQQHQQQQPDDSLLMRSPRILITQAASEEREDDEGCSRFDVGGASSGPFSWPMARRTNKDDAVDMSDDDDEDYVEENPRSISRAHHNHHGDEEDDEDEAEDYSRLLAAATSSMSASNSTTISTISMRPMPVGGNESMKTEDGAAMRLWSRASRDDVVVEVGEGLNGDGKQHHHHNGNGNGLMNCVIQFKEHLLTSQTDIVL